MVDGRGGNRVKCESENEKGVNDQVDGSISPEDVNDTLRGSPDPKVVVIEGRERGVDTMTLDGVMTLVDRTGTDPDGVITVP